MKYKLLFLIVGIQILFSFAIVNAQKQLETVVPQTPFDVETAMKMLNTGNSEIKCEAFYEERAGLIRRKIGDTIYARVGAVVTLYPITAYFAEYLELRKKDKKGKRMAAISSVANSFRILSKVYSAKGEFVFKGLAPGKYYVETTIVYPDGTGVQEVSGIAEIKTDGETVNVVLKKTF